MRAGNLSDARTESACLAHEVVCRTRAEYLAPGVNLTILTLVCISAEIHDMEGATANLLGADG